MDLVIKDKRKVVGRVTLRPDPEVMVNIGRSPDNDIVLERRTVSRHHAWIEFRDDTFVLIDNRSLNGTTVNGTAISEQVLKEGDKITFADYTALAEATPTSAEGTKTAAGVVSS